jgi:hypothetical protein
VIAVAVDSSRRLAAARVVQDREIRQIEIRRAQPVFLDLVFTADGLDGHTEGEELRLVALEHALDGGLLAFRWARGERVRRNVVGELGERRA